MERSKAELNVTLTFDRVVVCQSPLESYSAQEFLRLPMHQRIRCLLRQGIEFFQNNERVDRRQALASLRRAASMSVIAT